VIRPIAIVAFALSLSACGTSSSTSNDAERDGIGPAQNELRRFPGVTVTETGDGVQMAPGPGGALVGLRQADITDIRVLKSAAETSSYGPRGANGVVVITTTAATQ
jgi:TonB-dependent SusC/RagA subfamily outer membrane receptor